VTSGRQTVCIQGLGFVGAAMAVAVAGARGADGTPRFDTVGVDLPNPSGQERIDAINAGRFPFATVDGKLTASIAAAHAAGNLRATSDTNAFAGADIIIVDVNLDLVEGASGPSLGLDTLRRAVRDVGRVMKPGTLVIIETTTPPGTTAKIVAPELETAMRGRGLAADSFLLAHSYERVMPGAEYLDSIVNYWRVYAGHTPAAADAAEAFLSAVINVRDFPLTRLASTTASETAKVFENSYRAVNIAFIEEWARFAEEVGVDLFSVVDAIRRRPTHSNLRQPGFGVGGYCLTKDPLFAHMAAREIFQRDDLDFPFCRQAVALNQAMPLVSLNKLEALLGGLAGRKILLLGLSYRQDVGDTRHSPSETFYSEATARKASVTCHDPLVHDWPGVTANVAATLPSAAGFDAVVFAVPHAAYRALDMASWLGGARPLIFDANNVLSAAQRAAVSAAGCRCYSIGRGEVR
jgi:nucleotide sugar dehydrogenase